MYDPKCLIILNTWVSRVYGRGVKKCLFLLLIKKKKKSVNTETLCIHKYAIKDTCWWKAPKLLSLILGISLSYFKIFEYECMKKILILILKLSMLYVSPVCFKWMILKYRMYLSLNNCESCWFTGNHIPLEDAKSHLQIVTVSDTGWRTLVWQGGQGTYKHMALWKN